MWGNTGAHSWPRPCRLPTLAPHLCHTLGISGTTAHVQGNWACKPITFRWLFGEVFLEKITGHLACLTPYFSPLVCHEDSQPPIPIPACTRFCKSPFGNTRASHLTILLPPLSPHFPCTPNPHSYLLFRRVFQSDNFLSCIKRMGREGVWVMMLEGVHHHHQMVLWSPDNYRGPANQMQGAPFLVSSFCIPDGQKCHQLQRKGL